MEKNQRNKYSFDHCYQQQILAMLLCDRSFLLQSMQLIKPQYFIEESHEIICEILFNYFSSYRQLPVKFVLMNEIKFKYQDDLKKQYDCCAELESILVNYLPGLESRDSCLAKITRFAKERAMREAITKSLDWLERRDENAFAHIEHCLREALAVNPNFDLGLDYFQTLEDRYDRMAKMEESHEVFITGFPSIDQGLASGGVCRGEIASFMGSPGTGKSILLAKVAIQNLLRGKKILYISLEMDQDKLARRFDAQLARVNIHDLLLRREYVIDSLKSHVLEEEDKRKLIIKQFPAGTADVTTIRAYVSQLNLQGFKPDCLCVDYVGEFKDDDRLKTYESRQRVVRDLRAFGVEENHATFTAMQPNRRGREQQDGGLMDDDLLGDSYGQSRPLDALWSINQDLKEKQMGVGRMFVAKHRDGKSRYVLYFKQDRETLDIMEISLETYQSILSQYTSQKSDEVKLKKWGPNK